jgi:hypothetical protein
MRGALAGVLLLVLCAIPFLAFDPLRSFWSATDPILSIHDDSLTSYLAAETRVQDVRPLALQRGVHLDGTLAAPSSLPFALAGMGARLGAR